MKPIKIIVTFSGGKDSLAALLWTRNNTTRNFTTVFCDTGWENPITYRYIDEIAVQLNLDLVTLKSKKYDGLIDLAKKKTRFSVITAPVLHIRTQSDTGDRLHTRRGERRLYHHTGDTRPGKRR